MSDEIRGLIDKKYEFPLNLAVEKAVRMIQAFYRGHCWSPEFSACFEDDVERLEAWWELPPETLLGIFDRLKGQAATYKYELDIYGHEARYIIWAVDEVHRLTPPPKAEEE